MIERIGVFLCACGDNIGGVVDLAALGVELEGIPDIEFVAQHNLLCAPDGKAAFVEKMTEHGASHAVVVACSPKDHESDFQECMERSGTNKYLLQMANVREHCAWVTRDKDAAYAKARAMVTAAIERVRLHEVLEEKEIECLSNLVVIGGGVAGIEAALAVAQSGREVTLIDSAPSIGGRVPQYEEVAPTMECAPCLLSPRLSEVVDSPEIEVLTNTEATQVLGYLGSFDIQASRQARLVDEDLCVGCDECMNACPVEVPDSFDHGLGTRKAIYVPFPGSVPNCAIIDREHCLRFQGKECDACATACPMEAVDFAQQDETIEKKAGAIVLATGFDLFDPGRIEGLRYGALPEVYTLAEFERLAASTGPTGGAIQKKNGEPPASIAFVHCVGRSELGYCSGVCCEAALKCGLLAAKGVPGVEVTHLCTEIFAPGPGGASLRDRAVEGGSRLLMLDEIDSTRLETNAVGYLVRYGDGSDQGQVLEAEMVVLVTGMVPSASTSRFAALLDLVRNDSGYPAPDHPILRTAQSTLEGVYLAGCAAGPKGTAESIAQGQTAAGMFLSRLQPGRTIQLQATAAYAEEEVCSGCMVCVSACPYYACTPDESGRHVTVNEVLCQGCGTCVASCPSGAAKARHFTDRQIAAEIREVLHDRA